MHGLGRSIVAMLALGFPALQGAAALAQEFGDVEAGHALAREVCAVCHEVEGEDAPSPHPEAPTFRQVAEVPGMTAMALNVFFHTPHNHMPDLVLTRDEIRNVSAYILTMKPSD
jgi:mono/diheme cytochrome c family protein